MLLKSTSPAPRIVRLPGPVMAPVGFVLKRPPAMTVSVTGPERSNVPFSTMGSTLAVFSTMILPPGPKTSVPYSNVHPMPPLFQMFSSSMRNGPPPRLTPSVKGFFEENSTIAPAALGTTPICQVEGSPQACEPPIHTNFGTGESA